MSLLDLLLSVGGPSAILDLTPNKLPLLRGQAPQTDVIVDEECLARWCGACERWESLEDLEKCSRWMAVGRDNFGLSLYLCPQVIENATFFLYIPCANSTLKCFAKDCCGKRLKRRASRTAFHLVN